MSLIIFSQKRRRTPDSDEEAASEYMEPVMKRIEENRAALKEIVPAQAPKLRQPAKRKGKKKGESFKSI